MSLVEILASSRGFNRDIKLISNIQKVLIATKNQIKRPKSNVTNSVSEIVNNVNWEFNLSEKMKKRLDKERYIQKEKEKELKLKIKKKLNLKKKKEKKDFLRIKMEIINKMEEVQKKKRQQIKDYELENKLRTETKNKKPNLFIYFSHFEEILQNSNNDSQLDSPINNIPNVSYFTNGVYLNDINLQFSSNDEDSLNTSKIWTTSQIEKIKNR